MDRHTNLSTNIVIFLTIQQGSVPSFSIGKQGIDNRLRCDTIQEGWPPECPAVFPVRIRLTAAKQPFRMYQGAERPDAQA